ncbi:MAG: hypothetical protein RL092_477 [Bacteroidota bacterium]|jgi:hypothetical protein
MNFPKFLIFSQGNKIVKIFSFEQFEEYSKIGQSYTHQTFRVNTHADRLYVNDLLVLDENYFIDEQQYETMKNEMIQNLNAIV